MVKNEGRERRILSLGGEEEEDEKKNSRDSMITTFFSPCFFQARGQNRPKRNDGPLDSSPKKEIIIRMSINSAFQRI